MFGAADDDAAADDDDDDDDDDDWLQPGNKFAEAVSKRQNGITKHLFPYRLVVKFLCFKLQQRTRRSLTVFFETPKNQGRHED